MHLFFSIRYMNKRAVVKYVAILVDLDKRGTFVSCGALYDRLQTLGIDVDGTRDETCLSTPKPRSLIKRLVNRAHRRRLCLSLPTSDVGLYCPFVNP